MGRTLYGSLVPDRGWMICRLNRDKAFISTCADDDLLNIIMKNYPEIRPATKDEFEEYIRKLRENVENGTYKTYIIDTTNK